MGYRRAAEVPWVGSSGRGGVAQKRDGPGGPVGGGEGGLEDDSNGNGRGALVGYPGETGVRVLNRTTSPSWSTSTWFSAPHLVQRMLTSWRPFTSDSAEYDNAHIVGAVDECVHLTLVGR
jgi:hypothetical protein